MTSPEVELPVDETTETECGGCEAVIDCGEGYRCDGCQDFFCDDHLWIIGTGGQWRQMCTRCCPDEEAP
jgi:hypothetical protein